MENEKLMANNEKITFRLPKITRKKIDNVAKKKKTKTSKLIRNIIFDFLAKE